MDEQINGTRKVQVFTLRLNEDDMGVLISMLMEFPGSRMYDVTRKLEVQTIEQRKIPDNNKVYQIIIEQKKET